MNRKKLIEELSRIIVRVANSGSVEEVDKAVERILEEFYVIPKDPSLPLPASVHAAMLAVVNSEQARKDKQMTIGIEYEPTEEFLAAAASTMEELQKTDGAGVIPLNELNDRRRVRDGF